MSATGGELWEQKELTEESEVTPQQPGELLLATGRGQ